MNSLKNIALLSLLLISVTLIAQKQKTTASKNQAVNRLLRLPLARWRRATWSGSNGRKNNSY